MFFSQSGILDLYSKRINVLHYAVLAEYERLIITAMLFYNALVRLF